MASQIRPRLQQVTPSSTHPTLPYPCNPTLPYPCNPPQPTLSPPPILPTHQFDRHIYITIHHTIWNTSGVSPTSKPTSSLHRSSQPLSPHPPSHPTHHPTLLPHQFDDHVYIIFPRGLANIEAYFIASQIICPAILWLLDFLLTPVNITIIISITLNRILN